MEPAPPTRPVLAAETLALTTGVRRALEALPAHFTTAVRVGGMPLPDLFTLSGSLGATIERETVANLNRLRQVWDPEGHYAGAMFRRYSETFPDVRLERVRDGAPETLLGVELKGWFIFSKEGEPSFRYLVTPACCADNDILCVVPWFLDGAIDGQPQVLAPFVESARYVAEVRNYWWQHLRGAKGGKEIDPPNPMPTPYPAAKTETNDRARDDSGHNFGRVARIQAQRDVGILDGYVRSCMTTELAGVPASRWREFLLAVSDSKDDRQVDVALARMRKATGATGKRREALAERLVNAVLADEDND
jgi:hypothetical protein